MKIFAVGPKPPSRRRGQKGGTNMQFVLGTAVAVLALGALFNSAVPIVSQGENVSGTIVEPISFQVFHRTGDKNQDYCMEIRVDTGEHKDKLAQHCRSLWTKSEMAKLKKNDHISFNVVSTPITRILRARDIEPSSKPKPKLR